jgi:outer membrane autotransporter protein
VGFSSFKVLRNFNGGLKHLLFGTGDMAIYSRGKRLALACTSCFVLMTAATSAQTVTITSTDTPIAWPDTATINSVLNVPAGLAAISDVNVSLNYYHTWWNDANVTLTHGGTTVELYTSVLGGGNANGTYVIDDEAATSITAAVTVGSDVTPGTYAPEMAGALAAFDGMDPTGVWTLTMMDDATLDSGTLYSWSLIFTYAIVDQAKIGPTLPAIVSGDVTSLVGTFNDRANARFAGGVEPAADVTSPYMPGGTGGLWMRVGGGVAEGEGDVENLAPPAEASYDKNQWFAQAGASHVLYDSGDKKWVGSVFAQYSNSSANVADATATIGKVKNEGYGLGYSSSWLFADGFYVDTLSLAQWQNIDVSTLAGTTGKTDALTLASSAEVGMYFDLGNKLSLNPQLQGVYQHSNIDDFTDSAGNTYGFSGTNSLVGRAGLGLAYDSTTADGAHHTKASLTASVLDEFMDGGNAIVNGTSLGFGGVGGASWQVAGHVSLTPISQGFGIGVNASYRDSFKHEGESALAGDLTLSLRW